MDNYLDIFKNNIDTINNTNNMNISSSYTELNQDNCIDQNPNEEILKGIVENFLQKKLSKENEHKYQIEQTKKCILQKFYSITNDDYINQESKTKMHEAEYNFNQQNNNIPKFNANQKEYDELKEKYKNERNKKKSSIFKSEDLHISNTDIVHIKKEDYSPINPNVVDIENKNNIFIIQKKLFEDNDNNEEGEENDGKEKIEDIDEIELDFSEINNNKYEESKIVYSNYKNNTFESKKNTEISENKKNKNVNESLNYFTNDMLEEKREIDLCFLINNKDNKNLNKYNKQKQKCKNYSVQLVSSVGFLINNNNNNENEPNKKKRKEKSSYTNIINNINYGTEINNKIKNQINLNYLRNIKFNQNISGYSNYVNGNTFINNENNENDNSNNTIIPNNNNYNNNNYNGNKLINGSNKNYNNKNNQKNININKCLNEYKTLKNKNANFKNNISYLDYKNFSGRFSQKKFIKPNNNNVLENKIKKPIIKPLKKKNNSFVLNRDINTINEKIINKPVYQTTTNKNNLIYNNNNNDNINTFSKKNLLQYNNNININNGNINNKIIPIISKMPISIKVKKNLLSKIALKNPNKNNAKKIGNKIALLNTLLYNNLIIFQNVHHQHEAIEKLKSRPNNGVYFIYVDKIDEGYSFKGIYKRGPSEVNHICNKIFGIQNTPLMLSYEKFYILVENEDKNFEFKKLRDINVLSFIKTILLIKN